MRHTKKLSLQIAGAVVLATLWSTSIFAESRHRQGTSRSVEHGRIQRSAPERSSRFEARGSESGRFQSRDRGQPFESRDSNRRFESRGDNRRFESRNDDRRFESRGSTRVQADRFRSVPDWHGGGAPYRSHERVTSYGRVDRFVRERNGYRVWIGGGLYPIFIPHSYWRRFPLRVGLSIRFGGYWDPLGYWSVYDYSPYDGYGYGYYDNAYTAGVIHGVVESIDYRRGTLVLNDDISRQFVTVRMPRDRRMDDVRPGDYVELSGAWNRGGVFNAARLEEWDYGHDDRRY
jgi:hypothetical protein